MLRPRKSLGQNFLVDPNTVRKIVDAVRAPDGAQVVEIGPGTGAMTAELLARYPDLVAVEIDDRAVALLKERLPGLDIRHADVLDVDWTALAAGRAVYVVGNLPYYITSQILFGLLDRHEVVSEAVLMMQLEVAERLVAVPRTKAYGILSVMTQLFADPEILFRVSKHVFRPKPDVTSAVIRLKLKADVPVVNMETLRGLVRTAFNQRRKTLRNSLGLYFEERALTMPEGFAPLRAEELSPADFVELGKFVEGHGVRGGGGN